MKKLTFYLLILCAFLPARSKAQQANISSDSISEANYKFQPPKFIDADLFRLDLNNKLSLDSIILKCKRDTVLALYMYTFGINRNGKVVPKLYYDQLDKEYEKIQQFVENVFNKYRWQPAYKKTCKKCKMDYYLQLIISIDTDQNKINVFIKDINTVKNIFSTEIILKPS